MKANVLLHSFFDETSDSLAPYSISDSYAITYQVLRLLFIA